MTQSSLKIYETIPEKDILDMPESSRYRILMFLKKKPDKIFNSRAIAKACGFPVKGSCVEVRKAVTELLELDRQPIISTGKGFCYTQSYQKVVCYLDSLNNRKQGLQRRLIAVSKIAEDLWTGGFRNGK